MPQAQETLLKAIRESGALPTVPGVAMAIVALCEAPDSTIEKLAERMEMDPALATKTLRLANSSYYGVAEPITSLRKAIVRIGLRGAKLVALSFSLVDSYKANTCADFDFPAFWQRSLVTAVVARRIAARSVRHLADQIFVTALLADIGCPILCRTFPGQYRQVTQAMQSTSKNLAQVETGILGISHPEAGRLLLETWKLPLALVAAVAAHHDPAQVPRDQEAFTAAAIVKAAGDLSDIILLGSNQPRIRNLAETLRLYLNFGTEHLGAVLANMGPELEEVSSLLDVPVPDRDAVQTRAKTTMLSIAIRAGEPA